MGGWRYKYISFTVIYSWFFIIKTGILYVLIWVQGLWVGILRGNPDVGPRVE
jgi:hypothetical protein